MHSTVVQHMCVQYSGTAPVCAVQWYSTCVCSTAVQHLVVQYSVTAPVCAAQWHGTCVCSIVVQHLCVQYSGTASMCAVQWYSTCVCSTVVQHLCVQCATPFTTLNDKLQCCDTSCRCANISCRCATPGAGVQNQLQLGSKTLCHACMWQIGVQVLSALNPVDPLQNCDV